MQLDMLTVPDHSHRPHGARGRVPRNLDRVRPRSDDQLHSYVRHVLGFDMPLQAMEPGHDSPFEYLRHAFFEDSEMTGERGARLSRDCIVWANRGGGKTQLGAIATLLDLLFKPGIQVRILGGSFEQSTKMYRYLKQMLEREPFAELIAGNLTGRYVELVNGSRVEVLSQSECAVRGQRVHKIRCDEVELFEPDIWEAAQLVTRSGWCGNVYVRAGVEALSTMHRPFGLMQKIVQEAGASNRRVFRWSVLDTLRRCEARRACSSCLLYSDCGGRAKTDSTRGYIDIDDAIQQKRRVGASTWQAEMLCRRPNRSDTVYPEFDFKAHVYGEDELSSCTPHDGPPTLSQFPTKLLQTLAGDQPRVGQAVHAGDGPAPAHMAQYQFPRKLVQAKPNELREFRGSGGAVIGGLDFGYRNQTVLLWASVDHQHDVVRVFDELVLTETTVEQFIETAKSRMASVHAANPSAMSRTIDWIGADPAGHQRSGHTGLSTIALWRRAGFAVRTRTTSIEEGIAAVRRRLKRADGTVSLFIHRRCTTLIESLTKYHYPPNRPESAQPVKDGSDHAADALRYMIVNLDRGNWEVSRREY